MPDLEEDCSKHLAKRETQITQATSCWNKETTARRPDQNSGSAEHARSRKRVCLMSYRVKFLLKDSPIAMEPSGTVISRVFFETFFDELKTKGASVEEFIEKDIVQATEDMVFTDGVMCFPTTTSGARLGNLIVPCNIASWLCAMFAPIGHWSLAVCSELDYCVTHWIVSAAFFL